MADIKREDVMKYLENANMLEISELISEIEDKFGVSAAAPVAVAAAPGSGNAAAVEEQSEFDVELTAVGEKKINVIKAVREITALGLKEAKELVDKAPSVIKEAVSKEESEEISDFLMTLRLPDLATGKIDKEPLSKAELAQAKMLFERNFGCISCHETLNLVGKVRGGVSGPSLVNSGLRLKSDWIYHWLKTPKKFLPKGRMPVFALDEETAVHITKYILSIRTKP